MRPLSRDRRTTGTRPAPGRGGGARSRGVGGSGAPVLHPLRRSIVRHVPAGRASGPAVPARGPEPRNPPDRVPARRRGPDKGGSSRHTKQFSDPVFMAGVPLGKRGVSHPPWDHAAHGGPFLPMGLGGRRRPVLEPRPALATPLRLDGSAPAADALSTREEVAPASSGPARGIFRVGVGPGCRPLGGRPTACGPRFRRRTGGCEARRSGGGEPWNEPERGYRT